MLISGDLADHGADVEYERARELLEPLDAPLYVLPGNHDDRLALRRHFEVPAGSAEPVQYVAELGPLRLVALDSTRPARTPESSTWVASRGWTKRSRPSHTCPRSWLFITRRS